jgi:uncharacterized PurR-regulated membrane protein YhhQ (DUF165 family)
VTRILYPAAFIGTIFAANWTLQAFGVVPIGFGLMAPAGVLWIGLSFSLRDLTQDAFGRPATFACILAGAVLSALVSPGLALASGVAFLVSETADLLVYSPLRKRRWLLAITLSNTVGLVVDSALFLALAFGSLDYLAGQVVAKGYMTALAVLLLWWLRRQRIALNAERERFSIDPFTYYR